MQRIYQLTARIPLILRVVSLYIAAGSVLWNVPQTLAVASIPVQAIAYAPQVSPTTISGHPVGVSVERLGINLPVIDGSYNAITDSWTLTDDKAQFAAITQIPNNQSGNTFIYGHNTDPVFMKLAGLAQGDIAHVRTNNGHVFEYAYTGQDFVLPNNTSVLSDKPPRPRLTLMTCEGVFSQTRRIMTFDFKKVM